MKISKFINNSPVVPVILLGREIQNELDAQFKKLNLNLVDALVLVSIFFEDRACRPSEIADATRLSRSQVSQSLKRLETTHLLERSLAKEDSRYLNLKLTAAGKAKSQKVIKIFDQVSRRIDEVIGDSSAEKTSRHLMALMESFSQDINS